MRLPIEFRHRVFCFMLIALSGAYNGFGGVSRPIQEQYKQEYENKAVFLKVPIYSERQLVNINSGDQTIGAEQGAGTPKYKVGDQLRILSVDFSGDEIKFKMGEIAAPASIEIIFKFDSSLQETFPNRQIFDRALRSTFTEGLKYSDIENAKRSYVEQQFDRSVREIAVSSSTSRETVLKNIASRIPAYQEAQKEIDSLNSRIQELSGQLTGSQAKNRKLESDLKTQQAEMSRLKSANALLQEKMDRTTLQVSRLGNDLRDARGTAQGYQREIANIQRSLNLKVEANRDLTVQISDLGQAIRKLQKENEGLTGQIASIRTDLEAQQAANTRLVSDNDELKSSNKKLQGTIRVLSSKEDSLARKYVDLKSEKDRLDDFAQAVKALRTQIVEEKNQEGVRVGKANVYLKNTFLGSLEWRLPGNINPGETKSGEAGFSLESIDYVRLTSEEKKILHTLGEKLKMQVNLTSPSTTIALTPEKEDTVHEIGERETSKWLWKIANNGTGDAMIRISARLINKNSDGIAFFQQEDPILTSNIVRQVRGYLQPIPLVVGALIGFLLFGIVGIFRRPGRPGPGKNRTEPTSYTSRKEL